MSQRSRGHFGSSRASFHKIESGLRAAFEIGAGPIASRPTWVSALGGILSTIPRQRIEPSGLDTWLQPKEPSTWFIAENHSEAPLCFGILLALRSSNKE